MIFPKGAETADIVSNCNYVEEGIIFTDNQLQSKTTSEAIASHKDIVTEWLVTFNAYYVEYVN